MGQVITVDPEPIAEDIIEVLAGYKIPMSAADTVFNLVREEVVRQMGMQIIVSARERE